MTYKEDSAVLIQENTDSGTYISKKYLLDVYPQLVDVATTPGLWGAGRNSYGELGNNSPSNITSSPIQTVAGGISWLQVSSSCGDDDTGSVSHTAAIKTDGTLWIWGANDNGQIGKNVLTPVAYSSPIQTVASGTNWKQVACGYNHTAAIKTNGELWMWGANALGQIGRNSIALLKFSSPIQTIAVGTNWKQVACGSYHTAAIKTNGELWLWGSHSSMQLGRSMSVASPGSSPMQTTVGGTNWKQVACGKNHTAAIKTNGELWSWGANGYYQLGINYATTSTPVQTSVAGTNWRQVACGSSFSAAVKTDGTLWTWGYGVYGQLGNNSTTTSSTPVQTALTGTNWKQVACGDYHAAAIKTDGTLWSWGGNSSGQLGNNTYSPSVVASTPVQTIAGGTNWKSVSCGGNHTTAIRDFDEGF